MLVQGLTGSQGRFHGLHNRAYGAAVVARVTPGPVGLPGPAGVEGHRTRRHRNQPFELPAPHRHQLRCAFENRGHEGPLEPERPAKGEVPASTLHEHMFEYQGTATSSPEPPVGCHS